MKKKIKLIIPIIMIVYSSFFLGKIVTENQWENAYKTFSNPDVVNQLGVRKKDGMGVFSYKGRTYPLMTCEQYNKLVKSRIWSSEFVDNLVSKVWFIENN